METTHQIRLEDSRRCFRVDSHSPLGGVLCFLNLLDLAKVLLHALQFRHDIVILGVDALKAEGSCEVVS